MQFGRGKPQAGAFFDSDFTTVDQILAIGLLNGLQGKNALRVAIVTMSRPNLQVAGYIDMIERYYRGPAGNFSQVPPIGMRTAGVAGPAPAGLVAKNNHVKSAIDTGDPNTLIRNYLAAQYDQNCFFVLSGPATNLAAALRFQGVKDLIAAKSKYLVAAMPDRAIQADIPAAKELFAGWPGPIYAGGEDLGSIGFPGSSIEREFVAANPESPFIDAFRAFHPQPVDVPSWAMAAALYAGRPGEGDFKESDPGTFSISDRGALSFAQSGTGRHRRLSVDPAKKDQVARAFIELTAAKPALPQRFRPAAAL
jgi:hypothetical protein